MNQFKKISLVIFTLMLTTAFAACTNGNNTNSEDNVNNGDGNFVICTWMQKDDTSNYFIFYADKTVETYINGSLNETSDTPTYDGDPTKVGIVTINTKYEMIDEVITLYTMEIESNDGNLTATVYMFDTRLEGVKYILKSDSSDDTKNENDADITETENENGSDITDTEDENDSETTDTLMFMGYDNVVIIENGTDMTGITTTVYSLTSDTTLKFKGGINSITLVTLASAIGTNDSVRISLDLSETTGITEWTNKLAGLKNLYAISLPNTVISVVEHAFQDCTNLKAITVPKSITEFPLVDSDIIVNFDGTFWEWLKFSTIVSDEQTLYLNGEEIRYTSESILPEGITSIPDYAFKDCEWLTNITIPDSVTYIGEHAFEGCKNLTSISIPPSINLGDNLFLYCYNLNEIIYRGSILSWITSVSSDRILYYPEKNLYINGKNIKEITDIVIPDSVTHIRDSVFYGWKSLKTVSLPDGVKFIGNGAFSGCVNLTTINFPDGVKIGADAFDDCQSLTNITIPVNFDFFNFSIGPYLKEIYYKGTLENWLTKVQGVFQYSEGIDFYIKGEKLSDVVIPNSVTEIRDGAFTSWKSLESVIIPDGVSNIGNYAFEGCESLTSITLPDSIHTIGESTFRDCSSLTTINYRGTESQWQAINIEGDQNNGLTTAIIVYNYNGD